MPARLSVFAGAVVLVGLLIAQATSGSTPAQAETSAASQPMASAETSGLLAMAQPAGYWAAAMTVPGVGMFVWRRRRQRAAARSAGWQELADAWQQFETRRKATHRAQTQAQRSAARGPSVRPVAAKA